MVEVDFYTSVTDKFLTACRLAAKARANRLRTLIVLESRDDAETLDRFMWTSSALSFLPHCLSDDRFASETPVVLQYASSDDKADLLINLARKTPEDLDRFSRVIELVGVDEGDRDSARGRWRYYRSLGCALRSLTLNSDE
jgi:DNA polymerase-3 subunit chi